jgi:cytochrome P450
MLQLIVQALAFYAVSYALWHIFRKHVAPSFLKNVPGPDRDSIIYGNLNNIYSPWGIPWHMNMSRKFGRVFKIHGMFGDEQLYVSDPLALHHVVVKEQDIYEETGMFIKTNQTLFGNSLLGTLGSVHRRQRKMLNPVFSIAHMRGLVPIFYSSARQLREALSKEVVEGPKEINMRPWVTKIALEFIGRAGFGYSFQVFDTDASNEYRSALKDLMSTLFSLAIFRQFLPYLTKIGSPKFRRFMVDIIPFKRLHKMRDISDTITKTSKQIYEQRKAEMMGGIEGKDIMSVLRRSFFRQSLKNTSVLTPSQSEPTKKSKVKIVWTRTNLFLKSTLLSSPVPTPLLPRYRGFFICYLSIPRFKRN